MENKLLGLNKIYKKILAEKIICKYVYTYTPHYSGMYYHWTDIKHDKNSNDIILVRYSSHDYSPCIVEDEKEYINEVLTKRYDDVMKALIEHIDDFNDSPLGFVFNNIKKAM